MDISRSSWDPPNDGRPLWEPLNSIRQSYWRVLEYLWGYMEGGMGRPPSARDGFAADLPWAIDQGTPAIVTLDGVQSPHTV